MDPAIAELPRRLFSVEEVERMVDAGVLGEDEPVELIEGELVIVTPQGPLHSSIKDRLNELLVASYRDQGWVRNQTPMLAPPRSLPEPDLAVANGTWRDYVYRHPAGGDLLLAVEIAVTSHRYDHAKAAIYAGAGVPVLWIIDVPARRVEVHTEPSAAGHYRSTRLFVAGEALPLPGLDATLPIDELLP